MMQKANNCCWPSEYLLNDSKSKYFNIILLCKMQNVQQLCKSQSSEVDRLSDFQVATAPAGGDQPDSSERTFLPGGKRPPERSSHADFPVLHIFHCQVPDRDGLSVHLEAAPGIPGHRSRQDQELREEEHVKPLWRHMRSDR